jgi:hypothetical protein
MMATDVDISLHCTVKDVSHLSQLDVELSASPK